MYYDNVSASKQRTSLIISLITKITVILLKQINYLVSDSSKITIINRFITSYLFWKVLLAVL